MKGSGGKRNVRRSLDKRLKPIYTIGAAKHGKGLMVWGCFSGFSGLGPPYCIEGIMDKYIYNSILENQMIPFVYKCLYGGRCNRKMIPNTHQNWLKHGLIQIKSLYCNDLRNLLT